MSDKTVEQLNRTILTVSVTSSSKKYYEGEAKSVSSLNTVGPFDILPRHENFISLIADRLAIVDTSGKKFQLKITSGLLEVSANKVRIFIGI